MSSHSSLGMHSTLCTYITNPHFLLLSLHESCNILQLSWHQSCGILFYYLKLLMIFLLFLDSTSIYGIPLIELWLHPSRKHIHIMHCFKYLVALFRVHEPSLFHPLNSLNLYYTSILHYDNKIQLTCKIPRVS